MLSSCYRCLARTKRHIWHVPQRRANHGEMFPDNEVHGSLLGRPINLPAAAHHRAYCSRLPSLFAQLLPLPRLSTSMFSVVFNCQLDTQSSFKNDKFRSVRWKVWIQIYNTFSGWRVLKVTRMFAKAYGDVERIYQTYFSSLERNWSNASQVNDTTLD